MDTIQPSSLVPPAVPTLSPSKEGGQGGTSWLASILPSLDPLQRAYLGCRRLRRHESVAIARAQVDFPTLVRWREDEVFARAESITLAMAWDMGPQLARALLDAGAPQAASRLVTEVDQAPHSRDRNFAAVKVLEGARVLPTAERLPASEPPVGAQLLLELRRRVREIRDSRGGSETETTETVTLRAFASDAPDTTP